MLGNTICANMTESRLNYLVCEYRGHVYRLMPDRSITRADDEDKAKANYLKEWKNERR